MNKKTTAILIMFLLILCLWHLAQVRATLAELWRSANHCLDTLLGGNAPLIWKFALVLLLLYSALLFLGVVGKQGNAPNWRGAIIPLVVFILIVWIGKILHTASSVLEALHQAVSGLTSRTREPIHGLAMIMVVFIFLAGCLRLLLQNRNK